MYREPSDRKETEAQINDLEQKEEINIQPEQWRNKNSKKRGEAEESMGHL